MDTSIIIEIMVGASHHVHLNVPKLIQRLNTFESWTTRTCSFSSASTICTPGTINIMYTELYTVQLVQMTRSLFYVAQCKHAL